MKTFTALQEAIGIIVQDVMPPSQLAYLQKFASQMSNTFQPELPHVFDVIETELNKFGYSLSLDGDLDYGNDDGDDFLIYTVATGEIVKNVYLSLDWREISGKMTDWAARAPGKLRLDVHATFNSIAPSELDSILSDPEEVDAVEV